MGFKLTFGPLPNDHAVMARYSGIISSHPRLWILTALTATFLAVALTLKPNAQEFIHLEDAMVYPTFPFQGEYAGTIRPEGSAEPIRAGLQVAAYGDDTFRARLYHGGLPGDESGATEAFALEGGYEDYVLEFSAPESLRFRYSLNRFTAVDENGTERGHLQRVMRTSPTLGQEPPESAVVLFDGSNLDRWSSGARMTADGLLMQGATTADDYGDFRLHVEAKLGFMPGNRNQQRTNSGLYIQNRYEVQILDSFALAPAINGNSSLYNEVAPRVNASYPPLQWQTYDVYFRAPRFDDNGDKTENARITVYLNGVLVQDDVELERGTGAGGRREEVARAPLYLQGHTGPVRFRNVWLFEEDYSPPGETSL